MKTAILTSIPALVADGDVQRQYEEQRRCIDSWLRAGHLPISINSEKDISLLSRIYPDVKFHPTYRPSCEVAGEVLTFVHDAILTGLESEFDRLAFCNPDLFINYQADLASELSVDIHLAYSRKRHLAIPNKDGEAGTTTHSFDYVNMSKEFASTLSDSVFAFGHPWWEQWLILEAIKVTAPAVILVSGSELLAPTLQAPRQGVKGASSRLTHFFALHCFFKIADLYERRTTNLEQIRSSFTNFIALEVDRSYATHAALFDLILNEVGNYIQTASTQLTIGGDT